MLSTISEYPKHLWSFFLSLFHESHGALEQFSTRVSWPEWSRISDSTVQFTQRRSGVPKTHAGEFEIQCVQSSPSKLAMV